MKIFSSVFFMENLLLWLLLIPLTPCFGSNSYTVYDEAPRLMEFLVSIATRDTLTVIVYDQFVDFTPEVLGLLTYHSQRMIMYECHLFETFLKNYMTDALKIGSPELHMNLNFLVICGEANIEDMIIYVTHLDNTIGRGSLLRHFSTWLIISHDSFPYLNINLDNVAIIRISKQKHFPVRQNVTVWTSVNVNTVSHSQSKISVYTLLWIPEGRNWSRVHTCDLSGDRLHRSLFPNTQKGLNGRQLVLTMLETSDDQTYKALFKKLKNPIKMSNTTHQDLIDLCLQRLLQDKYVFMAPQQLKNFIKSRTCEVAEMKERLRSVPGGFIYPRHSPLRNLFHTKLVHLKELGVMDELIKEWTPKPMICGSSQHVPKFSLKNLNTVLVTCASSIILAAMVLLFEMRKKK